MNVRIRTALIVAAALAIAYSVAAWLIGLGVETQLLRDEQRLLAATPYVRLIRRDYRRAVSTAPRRSSRMAPGNRWHRCCGPPRAARH